MKHKIDRRLVTVAAMSVLASFLTVGCEHTVSRTETTRVRSNGSVKTSEETITESPNGTVTKTETKKTTAP